MSDVKAKQIGTPDGVHTYEISGLGAEDSVATMTAKSYPAGVKVSTQGYYTAGDGGQADYLVKTAADYGGTPDGYGDHTLANGNVAVLQHDGIVNVRQFGAKGDGTTDDAGAIQSCITNHTVLSFVNDEYNYAIASTLTVPSGKTILGQGASLTRKIGSGAFDLLANSDQVGGNTDIVIDGLRVDGNKDADTLIVDNVADRFSGISFIGVTGDSNISECTVTGTINAEEHGGIYVENCVGVSITGNIASANDRTGIVVFGNIDCVFNNNKSYSNSGSGISGGGNTDCIYSKNYTYSNGSGGTYTGLNGTGSRSKIINNISHSNTGSGINVGESTFRSDEALIQGNTCYSNTLEGFTVGYSDNVSLIGNLAYDNVRNNVRIFNGSNGCKVADNTIIDSAGGHGILINEGLRHSISRNNLSGNANSGLYVSTAATDGICIDNICTNNGAITSANSSGILLDIVTGWLIRGNRCYDTLGAGGTQETGIWLAGGSGNIIEGNRVYTNKMYSIRETSSPSYSRIKNKTGSDPLQGAVTANAASTTTTVNNNNVTIPSRIKIYPINSAALANPALASSVTAGASFVLTTGASSNSGEAYYYEIE
jgi:parallel beta-helix repeat protein